MSGLCKVHLAKPRQPPSNSRQEINRMIKEDIIEPATDKWASPIVFAPEKTASSGFLSTVES